MSVFFVNKFNGHYFGGNVVMFLICESLLRKASVNINVNIYNGSLCSRHLAGLKSKPKLLLLGLTRNVSIRLYVPFGILH